MNSIDRLTQLFMRFPGVGARGAKRFVYFLLAQNPRFIDELVREILSLKREIVQCNECYRYHSHKGNGVVCSVCAHDADNSMLMIVEKDSDFESVHRSGGYQGKYFILGGSIPVLEKDPASKIRIKELHARIESLAELGLSEIVIALSATPEGDFTRDYLARSVENIAKQFNISITTLGRGLSTGSELEYSDPDTLRHALKNRS